MGATFNILDVAATKGDFNFELIAIVINKTPDLVVHQDVDFKTNRVKKLNLTTELVAGIGIKSVS